MTARVEGWALTLAGLAFVAFAIAQPERVSQPNRPSNAPVATRVGTPFDLQGFIDQEINAGSKRIVVPPGRYRVTPRDRQHLLLRGLNDIQIVAEGVEMICTETTRALTVTHCTNVTVRLENIALFASNCFGFLEYNCDGSTYYRCRIDRRSASDDPVKRADPRLRSLDADAFHSKHAIKGPSYIECTARFMGDDCVNICGDYHMIMGSQGKELRVLAKHDLNIQPGDPVELVTYDGRRLPDAKAIAIQPDGSIRAEERDFLLKQRMNESLRTAKGALNKAFSITLDREVNIPMGGVICSANRIGNGFAVKGCTFGFNRSRGILIKASQGEVSGNRMEGCEMSAILVAPEYWWLEAGSSSDLRITGNTIIACKGIPICIEATAGNGDIAPAGAHQNLTITGNSIKECSIPAILVCSTRGLQIGENSFQLNDDRKSLPGLMRKAGMKELKPVVEIHCDP